MCTIGSLHLDDAEDTVHSFKQCDLTAEANFHDPSVREGKIGKYIALSREGRPGVWSGMNEHGVSFNAADSYTTKDYPCSSEKVDALFRAYEKAIATHKTARGAANFLGNFYVKHFPAPDIAMFSDQKETVYIEFTPPSTVSYRTIENGSFVATNHFLDLQGGVTEKHQKLGKSSHRRYRRADKILSGEPTRQGIVTLLQDEEFGESEDSICRHAESDGQFFTQASVLFTVSNAIKARADFVMNGNPKDAGGLPNQIVIE